MGLLTTWNICGNVFLIVGPTSLAQKRALVVEDHGGVAITLNSVNLSDLTTKGRPDVDSVVDGVFVVSSGTSSNNQDLAVSLSAECRRLRIPINVSDRPELCTFSLPSTFKDGPFQLGITTGGTGCRLANRIRRAAVNGLPANIGSVCENVGRIRKELLSESIVDRESDDDDAVQSVELNKLVVGSAAAADASSKLRWLSQMVEYFPIAKLADIQLEDLADLGADYVYKADVASRSASPGGSAKGTISLVGAGPGHAGLLTTDAMREIANADFVLADKLVPEEVLALVPKRTPIFIARKFPGNAERAQQELLEKGLAALSEGQRVVRLKQGDPYVYGRGAEEFLYFTEHGYTPKVIPGITSALAAPLLAKIPPTHRGYADQILVCTGTGRAGALPDAPEWVPTRTTIFLMALHRIEDIVKVLIEHGWDPQVACASIERASCPDQRVVRSKLKDISTALTELGSRPPGLLVVGRACEVLAPSKEKWTVEEGL